MFSRLNAILTSSKWTTSLTLFLVIVSLALGVGSVTENQFWFAINELLEGRDVDVGIRYGIGGYGILHAAVEGAIWGSVFSFGAGVAAGFVAGA